MFLYFDKDSSHILKSEIIDILMKTATKTSFSPKHKKLSGFLKTNWCCLMNTSFTTMKRHFDTIHKTPNCMSSSFHYHPHPTNQQMLNYQIICDQQMFCWNNVQRWELTKELKAQSYKLALIIHALIECWLFSSTDCLPVTTSLYSHKQYQTIFILHIYDNFWPQNLDKEELRQLDLDLDQPVD